MFAQILKHVCKVNANQFQITDKGDKLSESIQALCPCGFPLWKHNNISNHKPVHEFEK